MKSDKKGQSKENKEEKLNPSNKQKNTREKEEVNSEEERNGIIPDGMDFKKFIGCGG